MFFHLLPVINIYFRITPRIFVKIEMAQIGYTGARRKLIHERSLKSKISLGVCRARGSKRGGPSYYLSYYSV